ncbi:uncharacterized protein LOC131235094 [Magnolia sinica]|uniref:uncharacterized protein LOC131235094 n=1 Tax=Magnolia sinica TaxID=86752 RepID=UPI002659D356|nr:uncharacterized protein LOC131235094 [Magnolia sinica]
MAETESRNRKRVRVDSDDLLEFHTESPEFPEAKRFHADLLEILDDADTAGDRNEDLVTVMKSFEEEITSSFPPPPASASDSGESQPDLGYLLEASDDELGLPPTASSGAETEEDILRGPSETFGFGQIWGFDDEIPSYDALEFGIREVKENEEEPFVFEGLFDYSDVDYGQSDFSEVSWRTESLPAL